MREAARDLMAAAQAAETGADASGLAELGGDDTSEPDDRSPPAPGGTPTDLPKKAISATTLPSRPTCSRAPAGHPAAGRSGRTWGELPGHLRTEILQSAHGRYRDDYARLIQLYFREIAAGAAEKPAESPR